MKIEHVHNSMRQVRREQIYITELGLHLWHDDPARAQQHSEAIDSVFGFCRTTGARGTRPQFTT